MRNILDDLQQFMQKVEYMRGRQRAYFAQRNDTNLRMAKEAEKEVDQALQQLEKKGYKSAKTHTTKFTVR
jgi:cell division protein ZapA (FtsZ GTPase activity inhibitor)